MLSVLDCTQARIYPHSPAGRGYHVVYRQDEVNHCPGCGRTHWFIGRFSAECGFCATALPLAEARVQGPGGHSRNRRPFVLEAWAA